MCILLYVHLIFRLKVQNFVSYKSFKLINNISYLNVDYIDYFCRDILIINLKIDIMTYRQFCLDSQPWMRAVCYDLFAADIVSSLSPFEFSDDYDLDGNLVVGFRILFLSFLSMADMVHMNEICSMHGCFYIIRSSANTTSLTVSFYLETHG